MKMRSEQPSVAIIILNWNGREDTAACLKSLEGLAYENYEIVLVDNGSSDGSVPHFKQQFPHITLLTLAENTGFAGGNNEGMRYALQKDFDYVLLLNNDTICTDETFLLKMVEAVDGNEKAGIACPTILKNSNGRSWYAGGQMDWKRGVPRVFEREEWSDEKDGDAYEVEFATGCAMFIKRSVLEQVGGLDERYFLYNEDVDYCLRTLKQGFCIEYVIDAEINHKINASSGDKTEHGIFHPRNPKLMFFIKYRVRNRVINVVAHASAVDRMKFYAFFGAISLVKNLKFIAYGKFKAMVCYGRACLDGYLEGRDKKKTSEYVAL